MRDERELEFFCKTRIRMVEKAADWKHLKSSQKAAKKSSPILFVLSASQGETICGQACALKLL